MRAVVGPANGNKLAKIPSGFSGQFFPDSRNLPGFFGHPAYIDLLTEVIASPAFQRLADIRFLGAIDYLLYPNGSAKNRRHTRFEHSLGVAKLAILYSRECKLPEEDEKHAVVAGLLHDIGHAPLSHSLEPVFKETFRLSHHAATELILRSDVPVGASLRAIFRKYGIDSTKIIALISGALDAPCVEIFRNPINIDTIEGISRAYTYISPGGIQPPCSRVLYAMIHRASGDQAVLDGFWRLKNTVYDQLIASGSSAIADYICREYMRKNVTRFWSGEYFSTESTLRKTHPQLFVLLRQLRDAPTTLPSGTERTITYERRRFYIDTSIVLSDIASLYRRYRQEKIPTSLRREGVLASKNALENIPKHSASTRLI
jgi:hypothetical protein